MVPDPQGMHGVRLKDHDVCPDLAACRAHIARIAPWDVKLYRQVSAAFCGARRWPRRELQAAGGAAARAPCQGRRGRMHRRAGHRRNLLLHGAPAVLQHDRARAQVAGAARLRAGHAQGAGARGIRHAVGMVLHQPQNARSREPARAAQGGT